MSIGIHRVTSDWPSLSVSWNTKPTFDPVPATSFLTNGTNGYVTLDVKGAVQLWVNGTQKNHGVMLKAANETVDMYNVFDSFEGSTTAQRPQLTIDYTIPTTGKKQVEYVGGKSQGANSASQVTVSLPTGYQAGDLLLMMASMTVSDTANNFVTPAGWALLSTFNSGHRMSIFYKFAESASEAPPVIDTTRIGLAGYWTITVSVFRNVKRIEKTLASTGTTYSPPTITVDGTRRLLLETLSSSSSVSLNPPLSTEEKLEYLNSSGGIVHFQGMRYLHDKLTMTSSEMLITNATGGPTASTETRAILLEPLTNNLPTLTLSSSADSQSLTEGDTYKIEGTISDVDAGNALYLKYSIASGDTQTLSLGVSDGTNPAAFSKVLTYSAGRFWDGSVAVSTILPAENSYMVIWANDGKDDSIKQMRNFTVQQEDGKLYVPVNVVSQSYLVSQMARPVRLSNGWLVGAVRNSSNNHVYLYVSKDNGKSWLFVSSSAYSISQFALASKGTTVYVLGNDPGYSNLTMSILNIATYPLGFDGFSNNLNIDSGQASWGSGIAMAITPDGTKLWWAASTKNSSYPNSFNIRAGSIPILLDGTLGTPSSVKQVSKANTAGQNIINPSIIFASDGQPIILHEVGIPGSNQIIAAKETGTDFGVATGYNWLIKAVYNGGAYVQSSPVAIVTPNGKQHVAWHGADSSDTVNSYICYSNATTGADWLTTPKKLVKGTNASITSDKNGKLIITYEDGGYIKRIESTNEFASYSGPFTVGAGTKPATFYDQSFQTDFSVPPTLYQAAGAVKYYGVLNPNKKPVVTLTTLDNQTLTENATLSVAGSALDQDVDNAVTIKYRINGGTIRNIASGVSDGSTPLSFARDLRYSGKRMWDGAVDVAGADLAENTDHTLAVWAEDDKGGKSAEVTRKFRVVWNRPPTISGQNSDLGTLTERPTVTYSAADPEGNSFTFTEYLNGQQVRSFAGTDGQQNTFELTHDAWIKLDLDVQHQLKIVATDSAGISSERVYTFTRTETHLEFMLDYNNPDVAAFFTVDGMPERILFTLERYLPPDSEIESLLVTNNYLDATPTWEDACNAVIGGRGYIFTNKTKTAADWAICVWVTLAKGSATQRVHVYGYGGAFD